MAEMQPAPEAPSQEQGGGNATQLVSDIFSKLGKLNDLISQSQAVDDDDKQKLMAVIQSYEGFIDGLGNQKGQTQPAAGVAPVEAGGAKVQPAI